MNKVFGYTRVSTLKQGEGVSLDEQKESIIRYAAKHNLKIVRWFEEKVTAAKTGRPLFTEMMSLLKSEKVDGVVIHKIDRSTRNLKDWADIGELIDQGVQIHFAHESIDMNARGGRLSADIQAVIAADYIRNLRQEAKKGLYGRLKQGFFPFQAPIGYLDQGGGKLKVIDPIKGPLIKKLFSHYSKGNKGYRKLIPKLNQWGLTNKNGKSITKNGLTSILNNPFYIGMMEVKGKVFKGKHEPLITPILYKKVQEILKGKTQPKNSKHSYLFSRLITCMKCGYTLIASFQKGKIYYRCHTKTCSTKTLREDRIEAHLFKFFKDFSLSHTKNQFFKEVIKDYYKEFSYLQEAQKQSVRLQLGNLVERINRLSDMYIDGSIEKDIFEEKRKVLTVEKLALEKRKEAIQSGKLNIVEQVEQFLELAKSPKNIYDLQESDDKRYFIKLLTSNLSTQGKNLVITTVSPFSVLLYGKGVLFGGAAHDIDAKEPLTLVYDDEDTFKQKKKPLNKKQTKLLVRTLIEVFTENQFEELQTFLNSK